MRATMVKPPEARFQRGRSATRTRVDRPLAPPPASAVNTSATAPAPPKRSCTVPPIRASATLEARRRRSQSQGCFNSRPARSTSPCKRRRDVQVHAAPEAFAFFSSLSLANDVLTTSSRHDLPDPRASTCADAEGSSQQQLGCSPSEVQRLQTSQTGLVKLRITVHCAPDEEGLILMAVGNRKALGSWDPSKAPAMTDRGNGKWTLDVNAPPGDMKFKVIACHRNGKVFAEKGTRKLTVPSQQLALSMPGCFFSVSCVWGMAGKCTMKAARMSPHAAAAGIQEAEEQITRLRERQAKLQSRVKELSGKLKNTNMRIVGVTGEVKTLSRQAIELRRKAPAAVDPKAKAAMERLESLFDHHSWSGASAPEPSGAGSLTRRNSAPGAAPAAVSSEPLAAVSPRQPEYPAIALLAGTAVAANMVHQVHRHAIRALPAQHKGIASAFSVVAGCACAASVILGNIPAAMLS